MTGESIQKERYRFESGLGKGREGRLDVRSEEQIRLYHLYKNKKIRERKQK